MTPETLLTRHAAGLQWEDIPASAREAVSTMLLDTVGVMLAGLKGPECRNLLAQYVDWGGAEESSVVGTARRLPAPAAAFLGGVLAHWWEWDDTHDESAVHASAVIFPALIATAEAAGLDEGADAGREFVAAAVAAFDVACQMGAAIHPYYHNGVMATGVAGPVGAAAGVARLLGLDEKGIRSAMGIAAQQAGLSRQPLADRVNGKNILCGLSAGQAVQSAFAAKAGIKGAPNFLTGRYGLQALFSRGAADLEEALAGLGTRFSVTETSIKPYPCCRSTHPGLDLVFDMLAEEPGLGERVKGVEVSLSQICYELVGAPFEPGDDPRVAAQFSIPYTFSLALKRGRISLADFDPAQVTSDGAVLEMARHISAQPLEPEPGSTWWWPQTVRLRVEDGTTRERDIVALRGSKARPLTPEEQQAKLAEAGKGILTPEELAALTEDSMAVSEQGVAAVARWLRRAAYGQ